jgi:hypothetical protein
MRLFHTDEDPKLTVCFICERDNSGIYVDTQRLFLPPGSRPSTGRSVSASGASPRWRSCFRRSSSR